MNLKVELIQIMIHLPLLLHKEMQYVLPAFWVVMFAHRKSYAGNPMVVFDLSYDLSFKVISDF